MQRVGRDLHAAQVFAGLRSALRRCEAEFRAARRAEPQLRVDGQPQGVGHAFAEEHAEDRRPALDHQPFDARFSSWVTISFAVIGSSVDIIVAMFCKLSISCGEKHIAFGFAFGKETQSGAKVRPCR